MKTLIKNAYIVNENKIVKGDILIEGAYISQVGDTLESGEKTRVIDASGLYVLPGLIDDQVHFREPGLTHKGTIETESKAAVAGGITSFIEMPNTIPNTTTIAALNEKFEIANNTSYANYSFMFGGTNDNLEEIKKIDTSQVAGLKLFLGSSTGNMLVNDEKVLEQIFLNTDLVISVHCEDEETIQKNLAHYTKKYGKEIPVDKHPLIRSENACYISSSKAIALAKKTKARLHVFHLSTAKEMELFRNDIPLAEKRITAEVCIHHLWFTDNDYKEKGSFIKWNPAIKTAKDREALWNALNNDKIDIIASDHAPHTKEEKLHPNYREAPSGGPLVQHSLLALLTMAKQGKISLEKLVEKACHNPAILFAISKRGFIRPSYFADLVLVDLNQHTKVTQENVLYKCQWSPFAQEIFDAKIMTTFVNGTIAYTNNSVVKHRYAKPLTFDR